MHETNNFKFGTADIYVNKTKFLQFIDRYGPDIGCEFRLI